jgi:hypothetical protein
MINLKERICIAIGVPIMIIALVTMPIYFSHSPILATCQDFIDKWVNFLLLGNILLFLLGTFIFLMPILLFDKGIFKNKGNR